MTHRYSSPIRLLLLLEVLHDQQTSVRQKAYPCQAFDRLTNQKSASDRWRQNDIFSGNSKFGKQFSYAIG